MKIQEYKALEESINNQDFNKSYKNINLVMFLLSMFGHIASIFLSYFMLSKILNGVMSENYLVVFISSVIILTGIELLKRDIFDKFSFQYLKIKSISSKDVAPLLFFSIFIIGLSFYSSIKGAKEFSSKSDQIETNKNVIIQTYSDSLNKAYVAKIDDFTNEIKSNKDKIDFKDKEQTELESISPLTYQQKNRIKDLKREKSELKEDNAILDKKVLDIKLDMKEEIKRYSDTVSLDTEKKKEDNSENSLLFIIISTLIEITILAGVYFNKYYKFRSYKEYKDKFDSDPNYQKWVLYKSILEVIYNKNSNINTKLPSNKNIVDICKINDLIILQKDIIDFMKLMNSLKVIRVGGSSRYLHLSRDKSFEILKNHFNIY